MDTTQPPTAPGTGDRTDRIDELVERLADTDPAAAPPLAENVAAMLTEHLDGTDHRDGSPAGGAER